MKTKLDKTKLYKVKFVHCFDDDDIIEQAVSGRKFYRLREFMLGLGYEVRNVEELTS